MSDTVTGRLNFRLTPDQERSLRHAAALTGQSVSGFVLSTSVERAETVIARANEIVLAAEQFDAFVAAMDGPTEVMPKLREIASRPRRIPRE